MDSTYIAKVYLAGPFFTPEQNQVLTEVEQLCSKNSLDFISPRKFMILEPKASLADRKLVFDKNVETIKQADLILAYTDGYDAGTVWEMGFAFGINKPVIGYTFTGKTMNVMLANSCKGFLQNQEQVVKFLEGRIHKYAEYESTGMAWDFNWEVAQQWLKNIY
jgi:nucleoside 2-deoxyribosyltransferase